MRGALGVRIRDGVSDRTVTRYSSGLRFTKTAPGGHHSGSMTLKMPRGTFPDLGPNDKVFVYDTRNGRTVVEGYTENPGTNDGTDGQSFDLSFNGGLVLASDRTERLIYIDSTLDSWRQNPYQAQSSSGQAEVGSFPDGSGARAGNPALFCQFNSGSPVTTNKQVGMVYDLFAGSPMTVGKVGFVTDGGQADSNYHLQAYAVPYVTGDGMAVDYAQATGDGWAIVVAPTSLLAGKNGIAVRILRSAGGATNVTTENVWGAFGQVVVVSQFQDRYGASISGGTVTTVVNATTGLTDVIGWVRASSVVEDLIGRMLTFCDPALAFVNTTFAAVVNAQIDQLAWTDNPISAAGVLDELLTHEPDYYWEILETGTTGLHRFRFRAWPTTPRYQVSTLDGYNAPGGDADLCNRIIVTWTDTKGVPQVTILGTNVPELGNMSPVNADGSVNTAFVGRIKDADPITLPDGQGSLVNAVRIGTVSLAQKSSASKSGTVTVNYPIQDLESGLLVQPWEILPGSIVRVRETGDDLRLTEVEYQDSDGATTLTLGTPQLSDDQILAGLDARASAR